MPRPVIVVATDLSPASERGFGPAASLAHGLDADVVLLYVVFAGPPPGSPLRSPPLDAEVTTAKLRLQELASRFPDRSRVTAEVIVGDDLAAAIAQFGKAHDAAYLVVTTHGRTGVRRLVMGSVAEGVLRQSKVPVVVVPM